VRAYASNAIGTSYGQAVFFSTPSLGYSQVITHSVNNITATSAVGKGEIINDNGNPILAYGLCWRRNEPNPTI
jgi:hypothetical protein